MRKIIVILILIVASINSISQDVVGSRVIAKQAFFLKDRWIDSIRIDTVGLSGDNSSLMTAGAIYKFVNGRMSGGGSGDTSFIYSNLTWSRILDNEIITVVDPLYAPQLYYDFQLDMNEKRFFIGNVNDFAVNLNTNEWAISGNNGGANATTIISNDVSNRLRLITSFAPGRASEIFMVPDSMVFFVGGNGRLKIDSIRSGASYEVNKLIGWRDNNGVVGYVTPASPITLTSGILGADTSILSTKWYAASLAGSGTINTGTSGKPAYYTGSTTLDDFAAVDYATSGNNVTITQNNTTDVGLLIQLASSSAEDAFRVKNSGGTTLLNISSAGQLQTIVPIYVNTGYNGTYFSGIGYGGSISLADVAGLQRMSISGNFQMYVSGDLLFVTNSSDAAYLSQTGFRVGNDGAGTAPTKRFEVWQNDAATNTTVLSIRNIHQSSGTVTTGFGIGEQNELENASGTLKVVSSFETVYTDATNATEDADIVFKTITAGALVETVRLLGVGSLWSVRNSEKQGADVASAVGAIVLGTDGNAFEITGTSAITLISNLNWQNGSVVTLLFTSTASLTDGTANSGTDIGMELAGNANFTGSAGATLSLRLMELGGTQRWYEISRSVQ